MTIATEIIDDAWVDAAVARVRPMLDAWADNPELIAATMAIGFGCDVVTNGIDAEISAWEQPDGVRTVIADELLGVPISRLPHTVFIIAARTLPASAMRQILWARILGAHTIVKAASGQDDLGKALCLAGNPAGHALEPQLPDGDRDTRVDAAITSADAVVVLGSDTTIASLRSRTPPEKAFAAYGHKISMAVLPANAEDAAIIAVAHDVVAWDRSGCLSPAIIWTENPDAGTCATRVAAAIAALAPADAMAPASALQRRVIRTRAAMQGRPSHDAGRFVVVVDRPDTDAPTDDAAVSLRPFDPSAFDTFLPVVSTVGVASRDIARWLAVVPPDIRIAALGTMQSPPLSWRQDGLRPLRGLLRPVLR